MSEENKDNAYSVGIEKIACLVANPGEECRSSVVTTKCKSCNAVGPTEVTAGWDVVGFLSCYYYGWCWWCFQTVKGKDYTMKNAEHKCSSCKASIAQYHACC